ncbi:hypothetical protein HanRHA438_Chr07g0307381 [Helianthus annuus]|nr:hypothetical protein HanIR_Chr07g0320711 [Helianthus annuus]KAJ0908168.1 hypothetical protein HanRHA438_Chr07g0307381 [Helianthus annuus]
MGGCGGERWWQRCGESEEMMNEKAVVSLNRVNGTKPSGIGTEKRSDEDESNEMMNEKARRTTVNHRYDIL